MYAFAPARSMRNLEFAVAVFLLGFVSPLLAYDVNGVSIGGSETELKKAFPSALCKPLEWASPAADRRCDDSKISIGGIESRITFYLKKNAIEAFDVRFDMKDLDRFTAHAVTRRTIIYAVHRYRGCTRSI